MIHNGRVTAAYEGPIAVFIIGMRINQFLAVRKWWPVTRAMPRMLEELAADPESGFLHAEAVLKNWRTPMLIQYWRSFEHLHAYAHDPARDHQPAWRAFNAAIGGDGSVGIFHETYIVDPGRHESIYVNMPPIGLAAIANTLPATGNRKDARRRMGETHPLPNKSAP